MFFTIKESNISMLEHKKRQKEEEMETLRKEPAEMDRMNEEKEQEKRARQLQQVVMLGLRQGSSTYLRPKKLGL